MEANEIKSLLEVIDQQVSSSILGGMEEQYEQLEEMGFITIDRHSIQHSASITRAGLDYINHNYLS
ncbi:MAG TPA: hypothetical protein VKB19_16270 [Pedobacter sp.]|nr:hypothetical protein [Pedobacter sp.]